MSEIIKYSCIILKQYIHEKEFKEITELSQICTKKDNMLLKLEQDYKLSISKKSEVLSNIANEFMYYVNNELVSYIGISCFGGNIAELNGMTHPRYRRKGLFKKLFDLAISECRARNYSEILLLSYDASIEGKNFIKSNGGKYRRSEYSMKYMISQDKIIKNSNEAISLTKADKSDSYEISKQNSIYWGEEFDDEEVQFLPNTEIYMIKKSDKIIGKIHVEYNENYAYIFGFGIKPEYRCNGYGRIALRKIVNKILSKNIKNIKLDVACENVTALNIYKECGFIQTSVMNYYEIL